MTVFTRPFEAALDAVRHRVLADRTSWFAVGFRLTRQQEGGYSLTGADVRRNRESKGDA